MQDPAIRRTRNEKRAKSMFRKHWGKECNARYRIPTLHLHYTWVAITTSLTESTICSA